MRAVQRYRIVHFYLWWRTQSPQFQILGCTFPFPYLTGFRVAEVRPFQLGRIADEGVVVARARQAQKKEREHLLPNRFGQPYTGSG